MYVRIYIHTQAEVAATTTKMVLLHFINDMNEWKNEFNPSFSFKKFYCHSLPESFSCCHKKSFGSTK